jgi:hypothetical protein
MALIPITAENLESVTLVLHPHRAITSSSAGVTSPIRLVDRPSSILKNIPEDNPANVQYTESQIISLLMAASENVNRGVLDVSGILSDYMRNVNKQDQIARNFVTFSPMRYEQPTSFADDYTDSPYLMRRVITETLMPFYRHGYSWCDFSCGNYHTLNFFSSPAGPNNTALIYANKNSLGRAYTPAGDFSLDFYINPRYVGASGSAYTAGTIMHLSSSFAVSLVSGSSRNQNQEVDGFRILLQLSQSADTNPSAINLAAVESGLSFPNNLTFISPDNSLTHNHWHHVTIRWGGSSRSFGTGSIIIDDTRTSFNVPSSSLSTDTDALVIGNFYQGSDSIGKFFNTPVAANEGIPSFPSYATDPTAFSFNNQLQAEVHDLKIYKRFLNDADIRNLGAKADGEDIDLLFYVPVTFSTITNKHRVLISPFDTAVKQTYSPINADMALGVNGFYMNLENFTKDFKTLQHPRLYNLTSSVRTSSTLTTANQVLYQDPVTAKRNLTILPNDNGLQIPDFSILNTEVSNFFLNDLGNKDYSIISMRNLAATGSFFLGLPPDYSAISGITPTDMVGTPGPALAVAQNFKDLSSNQTLIFDLTTLGYGRTILPGSFSLTDKTLSGSFDKVSIRLKDNGNGSLYRADCATKQANWNSVGNIFYVEGTLLLTNPSLALFGKDVFKVELKGEQRTNVFIANVPAPSSLINSSSNPSYQPFPVTDYVNEREDRFVYITGINLHDENLNVIMRANLAQPVAKRDSDEFLFRLKYDF